MIVIGRDELELSIDTMMKLQLGIITGLGAFVEQYMNY